MHEIDGSAGGGQMVRSAVSLSALSGEAVRVENVRGDRSTPGMRPQHVAAVEAAAALTDASVEGAEQGAETLVFDPGSVSATDVSVDVGTAGSIALVFDTVLPLATALSEPASVTVTGGTDVEWAPPLAYTRRVKLPVLAAHGLDAAIDVEQRGFYPAGGGEATLSLSPSSLSPLALTERGPLRRLSVVSVADDSLAEADVAERQAAAAVENIDVGAPASETVDYDDAACAGSSVTVVGVYEHARVGFSALGEKGTPAETVAAEAAADFQRFHESAAAVDERLADQLLVYQALAGGTVRAPSATAHVETNRQVIEPFGYEFEFTRLDDTVRIERAAVDN